MPYPQDHGNWLYSNKYVYGDVIITWRTSDLPQDHGNWLYSNKYVYGDVIITWRTSALPPRPRQLAL